MHVLQALLHTLSVSGVDPGVVSLVQQASEAMCGLQARQHVVAASPFKVGSAEGGNEPAGASQALSPFDLAAVKAKEAELHPLAKRKAEAEEALLALTDKVEADTKEALQKQVAVATEALERAKTELGVLKEGKGLDRSRSRSPVGRRGAGDQ